MTSIYIHNVDNPTMIVEWKQDSMGSVYSLTTIHTQELDDPDSELWELAADYFEDSPNDI